MCRDSNCPTLSNRAPATVDLFVVISRSKFTKPLCSVVLCTFNRAHTLDRAIASVLDQGFTDWELVVVDDGSVDDTAARVIALAQSEPRILYVRQPNRGLAAARNTGIRAANGKWIAFLDSDDEYAPTFLSHRFELLKRRPQLHAVWGGTRLVGPRPKQYVPDMKRPGKKIHLSKCFVGGTLVVQRQCLLDVGGFRNLAFAEDSELFLRLKARFATACVQDPGYIYHLEGDNRLSTLFTGGGAKAVRDYRLGGTKGATDVSGVAMEDASVWRETWAGVLGRKRTDKLAS